MNPGDPPLRIPPVIPVRLEESAAFSERGSVTRSTFGIPKTAGNPLIRPSATFSPSDGEKDGMRGISVFWILGISFLAAAGGCVLYHFNPSFYGFYPRCGFNALTGLLCPGCGSQRAMYQLIHGHLMTACRCNLLLILTLPWFAVQGGRYLVAEWWGTPGPQWLPHPRWYKWLIAAAIVFAILRNIPGAPFCYLAPP